MEYLMNNNPFDHIIIDDFLEESLASKLSSEFMDYNDPRWYSYNNPLEHKKTSNKWYFFPSETYKYMAYLNSEEFIDRLRQITGIEKLYPDIGLHGAGWHIHGRGGKLNIHKDYSIHPKLKLQRKLNIIIYLTPDWNPEWGGGLDLWSHDPANNIPLEKIKTVEYKFNRAILFDTTQNSWHGFNEPLTCPDDVHRKSIAMYYLTDPPEEVDTRQRALYAASESQQNDPSVLKFIQERSKL